MKPQSTPREESRIKESREESRIEISEADLRILALRWLGLTFRDIARLTRRPSAAIARVIKKHRGEFADPGPPAECSETGHCPTPEQIWGRINPSTGIREGGLVAELQAGWTDADGRRHPAWSKRERRRRTVGDGGRKPYQTPCLPDPMPGPRGGLELPAS